MTFPTDLTTYLDAFGPLLAQQAQQRSRPLHTPGRDQTVDLSHLLRPPLDAQLHIITAVCRAWEREKGLMISAEMGTGKTLMAIAAADYHGRHEYRAIVMCPPHLCLKWEREVRITLPAPVTVKQIKSYKDLTRLELHTEPVGPEWYIVSQTRAKLGTAWKPAYRRDAHDKGRRLGNLCCPDCQALIWSKDRAGNEEPTTHDELAKSKRFCESCGAAFWTWTNQYDRWPVAHFIKRHLPGYFDFLIVDECFPAGTAVETPRGPVPIESIRPGDMVLTVKPGGWIVRRRVVRLIAKRRRNRLLKITHTAGTITCTENHKFVSNLRLTEASKLRIGDRLQVYGVPYGFETRKSVPNLRNFVQCSLESRKTTESLQHSVCEDHELEHQPDFDDGREEAQETDNKDLRAMREGVFARTVDRKEAEILWQELLQQDGLDIADYSLETTEDIGEQSREGQASVVRENEKAEQGHSVQNSPRRHQPETERKAVCRATWRERTPDTTADRLGDSTRTTQQHGVSDSDGSAHMAGCSCRHCDPRSEAGDRVRWGVTYHRQAKEQGPEEGVAPVRSWVDSSSCLELRHREASSADSQGNTVCFVSDIEAIEEVAAEEGDLVYDLEVSGTHLYFANGVLVSNCHQAKSAETAHGTAVGGVAAAVDRVLFLSGTVFGGYAWHTKAPLFRLCPRTLVQEGFTWAGDTAWNEAYGRIETKVIESESMRSYQNYNGEWNSYSIGKKQRKMKSVKPGVMPSLFGRHLIGNTVFLSLDEVADNLPALDESVIAVDMDDEQRAAYDTVEHALRDAIKQMLAKGDKRLLSTMLQTLLGYCDHPWGWGDIGYYDEDKSCAQGRVWKHVVTPPELDRKTLRPKERAVIEFCKKEKAEGRRVWLYAVMTDKRDVVGRLGALLPLHGLRTAVLRSSVETTKREEWMEKHVPDADVIVSHPQLVETGLDFFSPPGAKRPYNVPTVAFYQTGYNLFTLRQASRRAWRIGQFEDCRIRYFFYEDTMQARAMALMGKKLTASQSMEGKFSMEGLAALAGDEGTIETAMARSLVNALGEDLDVGRAWTRVGEKHPGLNAVEKRFVEAMQRIPGTKQMVLF